MFALFPPVRSRTAVIFFFFFCNAKIVLLYYHILNVEYRKKILMGCLFKLSLFDTVLKYGQAFKLEFAL